MPNDDGPYDVENEPQPPDQKFVLTMYGHVEITRHDDREYLRDLRDVLNAARMARGGW